MADETNVLDQLVGQIPDAALRTRLAREVELLRGSRRFGLVFDRHLPESVRLPDHPIRKGVKVALRDESTRATWRVIRFTDPATPVAVLDGDGGERPVDDLVVVREFGEPVFPGLRPSSASATALIDAPWHTVINGENFHVLQALRSTHRGKVDLIYIDPPYNTGNEGWIYNDRYVDANDRAKSTKWLSFMERRFSSPATCSSRPGSSSSRSATRSTTDCGCCWTRCSATENFIANVVWQGSVKNDARYMAGGSTTCWSTPGTRRRLSRIRSSLARAQARPRGRGSDEAPRHGRSPDTTPLRRRELLSPLAALQRGQLEPGSSGTTRSTIEGRVFQGGDLTQSRTPGQPARTTSCTRTPAACRHAPTNGWRYYAETHGSAHRRGPHPLRS